VTQPAGAASSYDVAELPGWLVPLAEAASRVRLEDMGRFLQPPAEGGGRRSAVLILLGEDAEGPKVLITERAPTLRAHAGQPSFPGGRLDPDDDGPVGAALREAHEETGLDPAGVEVFAVLPDVYLQPSKSVVTPVLGWWRQPSTVSVVDSAEVASVHLVGITQLADPANRLRVSHPSGFVGPAFTVAGLLVWGFTAMLLDHVLRLGGFERPWDVDRIEELPADVVALAMRDRAAAEVTPDHSHRDDG
jgi:8-oxo-dGTP pyrophosphatase MutT (NUDIX family)